MLALVETLRTHTPLWCIGVCLLAVAGIVAARRKPNVREGVSLITAVTNFVLVLWIYKRHDPESPLAFELANLGKGLEIAFRVDELGLIFALVASSLWILNTLYSIGYMRAHDEHKQTRFFSCFAIAIAAVMGGAFASNLFTMFAFYEMLTICTYPLVIHAETDTARAGARRYLSYLLGASIGLLLPALFLIWHMFGTFEFTAGGIAAPEGGDPEPWLLGLTFGLCVFGIAKCAIMPFHSWLPAAMVAPTPVSALLHAVAVVKMGVFGVCRIVFHVFGPERLDRLGANDWLVFGACFTIVCASLVALAQDNLKRRLAYSTISQLSYVLLGAAMLVPAAATGGMAHIGFHAFSKITLFFGAGAIYVASHKTLVSQLDGLARKMPITMTAFSIGALSMIGLPPVVGIWSKLYLANGAADGGYGWVLGVLVVSALLNAGYFLPIIWRAFFRPPKDGDLDDVKEAPWPCVVALSVTAGCSVLMFFMPELFLDLAEAVADAGGAR